MHLFGGDTSLIRMKHPAWCSEDLWESITDQAREHGGRLEFAFTFSKAEKKVLRKRKPIRVSDWAEKHRVITMSVLPGLWKNDVTPYLTELMDAAAMPCVREIIVCKVPQTGVSECAHNFVGYCIDRDPGPVLYVYPDEVTAKENSQDRILPMIQSSARLRSYFTGAERDKSSLRINLQHMMIYLGWGRSAARLANKPIKYAIADEIDKDGFDAGKKEAGALDLIDKRLTTFRPVSKYWKISTPTLESGNIWVELTTNTHVVFDYHVTCPLCGRDQLMDFTGIKWDGGAAADPKQVKAEHLAWYECEHCQGRWDDTTRNKAVRLGAWMARGKRLSLKKYMELYRPANIGFHIPAWISFFVSLSECAASFIEGQHDLLKLQDFLNAKCALPWKARVESKSEESILTHRNHLPAGVVPADALALTAGIDVQKHGFWFVVRAWTRDLSSHLVQYGYLSSWQNVEDLLFKTRYPVEGASADHTLGIWRAAMDTGGDGGEDGEWSRTEEIYHWIRKNSRGIVFGIKGESRPQVKRIRPRVIDKLARGNRPIPGGLTLYFLDTDQFKELFHWRLSREEGQSQRMTLHAETGLDYALQVLAEEKQKDRSGKIAWVPIRRDNHLLDCENYAAACADPEWAPSLTFIAGRAPKDPPGGTTPATHQTDNRVVTGGRSRPSWFGSR